MTADYAHRVLVPRLMTGRSEVVPIIENSVVGQVELAGSFLDRVRVAGSLPLSLFESGAPEVVSGAAPLRSVGVGDPRLGVLVRLFGDAEHDALSLHLGVDGWIPIGGAARHVGDLAPRVMPRVVLAGSFGAAGKWTAEGAFLVRPVASIGPPQLGMTAGPELRVGVGVGASLLDDRLYLGPEVRFSSQVIGSDAFRPNGMSLELLGGLSWLLGDTVMVGLAGGSALFGAAGTPDARAVLRIAYAPRGGEVRTPRPPVNGARPDDLDDDGVVDALDRCPFEPENRNGVRDADGCPEFEGDAGASLARVLVATTPPRLPGVVDAGVASGTGGVDAGPGQAQFFTQDSDGDSIPDEADRCPVTREDDDDFEDDDGCPEPDNDADGVADALDRCPTAAETRNGVDDLDGCPDVAPDADGDGVADAVDRCPFEPENVDGLRDEDGCPDFAVSVPGVGLETAPPGAALTAQVALARILAPQPLRVADALGVRLDGDRDGVDDEADRCPLRPEDRDQFEDEDGCPELDDDADGLEDPRDQCPLVAETFNGWKDDDGCPDEHGDVDADGVEYERDRCPLEPGDERDGCPHVAPPALALAGFAAGARSMREAPPANASTADFDRDGTPDDADKCPMTAEDKDSFEDDDGCPEPDNDADGIDDAKDKCPFEAETINGNRDEDGCPDLGSSKVHLERGRVVLDETVQFKTASATLTPASNKLLKQVAGVLKASRSLSVEIQGHTDDVGSAATNIKLSQKRADAIRAFLVKAGVAPARLLAKGYGPTKPRASNVSAEGREQNRRVEFLIIGEAK